VLDLRLNARVIATADPSAIFALARLRGWPVRHAARLADRAETVALALEHLTAAEAGALRSAMAEVGGIGAVLDDPAGTAQIILVGARTDFDALASRLHADLAPIGEVIRASLAAHAVREFDLPMAGRRRMKLGPDPVFMGIVNATPDSFSDGGRFPTAQAAADHARRLVDEGASIVDVGGESTRPGSDPVPEDEELARVIPVIERLAGKTDAAISVDTRRSRVARQAVAAGAAIVNDVTALRGDPDMAAAVAETGAAVVLMHMLGTPRTMQESPRYDDLLADLCRSLRECLALAKAAGVAEDRILVDPGLGFGKTVEHNLEILARLAQLRTLGRPIVVGPSRKRFIGFLTGVDAPAERVLGTAGACALAVAAGACVLRVHDVAPVRQAVTVAAAIARAGGW